MCYMSQFLDACIHIRLEQARNDNFGYMAERSHTENVKEEIQVLHEEHKKLMWGKFNFKF